MEGRLEKGYDEVEADRRGDAREMCSRGPLAGGKGVSTLRRTLQKGLGVALESSEKTGGEGKSRGRHHRLSSQSLQSAFPAGSTLSWQRKKGHCSPMPLSSPAETLSSVAFLFSGRKVPGRAPGVSQNKRSTPPP